MSSYTVSMTRSPGLSDGEVRRRLHAAYSYLIELGRKANNDAPAESARTGAGASESGDVESTANHSVMPERAIVKRRGVAQ